MKYKVLLISLVFCVITISIIILNFSKLQKNEQVNEVSPSKNEQVNEVYSEKNEQANEVSPKKDGQVDEVYPKILQYNSLGIYGEEFYSLSFYKKNKVTLNTLSNIEKVAMVLKNIKDPDIIYEIKYNNENLEYVEDLPIIRDGYSDELLAKTFKNIFGVDNVDVEWIDLNFSGGYFKYVDDGFYGYQRYSGGMPDDYEYIYDIKSVIKSVKKDKDYLYIYDDYALFEINYEDELIDDLYKPYFVIKGYKTSEKKDIFYEKTYGETDDNVEKTDEIIEEIYNNNKKDLYTYKHTFKKNNDGTYYWVSSEIYND